MHDNLDHIIAEYVRLLTLYKRKYYEGEPMVSDKKFDMMEDRLRDLAPNHEYFTRIGYDIISH